MKHLFTLSERLKGRGRGSVTSAISATSASAIFVGKVSNESTVRYRERSRIPSCLFRYSLAPILSRFSLVSLICLCMLTLGVGNVWGAVKNISASNLNGMGSNQYASDSKTIDGFTISATGCYGTTQFRITKNKTITITCPSGNLMTGITFSTTSGYGISASNLSNQSWSDANGENSISFTHTGNSAARITNIAITYTTTASCSVDPVVQATSGSAVNVTGATISCAGITKGDCDIDEWGFVYGTATGPTGNVQKISSGKSTTNVSSFNKTLTGLDPNTKYYVRAYAKIGGNIYYGTETNFTTKKITATSSSTTYGTVSRSKMVITGTPKANCRYASPAYTISGSTPDNATTVSQNGNTFTVSSTSTTDVTITINFEAIPTYTLNYYDGNGAATRNSILEGTNLIEALGTPAASCDATSTTFMGWTTTEIATKTNTAPTYVSADAVVNSTTAAATYYAVYAKGTETQTPIANSWTRITSTSQLTDGATVMLVQYYSDYAINTNPGATSCTANAEITNSNTALRWIAVKSGSKWKFKTSGGAYLSTNALDNNTNLGLNQTYDEWTISADNGGTTGSKNTYTNTNCFRLNNGSDLEYYSEVFKLYTWSLKYSSAYPFYIYIQKTTSTTTYSQYLTTCCTPLAQVEGSVNWSQGEAELHRDKIDGVNSWAVAYKLHSEENYTSHSTAWTDEANNRCYTTTKISGLEAGKVYDFKITATPDGEHCAGDVVELIESVTVPQITTSAATITNLNYAEGSGPSAAQSFTVSGSHLTGNLTVTAPANFKVCATENGEYTTSVELTPTEEALSNVAVYVKMNAGLSQAAQAYTGNITISGGGAASKSVALSGIVSSACEAPTINTQPADATYDLNADATALSVEATKNGTGPALTYQWYSNTENSNSNGTLINGATSSTYIPSTSAAGTKYYYCVVSSGACATPSACATIEVNTPAITVSGASVAFGDKAKDSSNELTFTVSGANLAKDAGITLTLNDETGMYSIDKTSLDATSNAVGETTITVTYAPTAVGTHNASITIASTGAEQTVNLSGTGKWLVTWNVAGQENPFTNLAADGGKPTLPTPAPANNTLGCANAFMGWSAKNGGSVYKDTEYYDDLFSDADDAPTISAATPFYAVFATQSGSDPSYITFDNSASDGSDDISSNSESVNEKVTASSGVSYKTDGSEKVYAGTYGMKIGAGSATGTMVFTVSPAVTTKTIKVNAKKYSNDTGTLSLTVNGKDFGSAQSPASEGGELTFTVDDAVEVTSVTVATSSKRAYIKSVSVGEGATKSNYVTVCPAVEAPTFSPAAGEYHEAKNVEISCATVGYDEIRYTTDGTDPTKTTGTVYSSAITVDETTTIKAIAVKGDNVSDVVSATYTITYPRKVTFDAGAGTLSIAPATSITEEAYGEGITLPSATPSSYCVAEGWTFAGWATTNSTTTAPTIVSGTYTPESDIKLYAVYKLGDENYHLVTELPTGEDIPGDYMIVNTANTKAMDAYVKSTYYLDEDATGTITDNTIIPANVTYFNYNHWTVTYESSKWIFYNEYQKKYLYNYCNDGTHHNVGITESEPSGYTIALSDGFAVFTSADDAGAHIWYDAAHSDFAGTTETTNNLHLYKQSTPTYSSTPVCCDDEVTVSKADNPSTGTFTINKSGVLSTCAGSQVVTVTCVPNAGYHVDEVTETIGTGVTIKETEENVYTITYDKNVSGISTISVTFAETLEPNFQISQNAFEIGDVAVGATVQRQFTISAAHLEGTSLSITSSNDKFTVSPTSLTIKADGSVEEATVTVTLNTTAVGGPYSATITLADGATTPNTTTVSLTNATIKNQYNVKWYNGTDLLSEANYLDGATISVIPTAASCDQSISHVGWLPNATIDGKQADAPAGLVANEDIPAVTADVEYHAVFAKVGEASWRSTDLADLTSEDVFVIAETSGYALSHANGASSAPAATSITIENNKITSEVVEALKWNVSGSATNGYTFYPNGSTTTWLYCNNSNDGVRVGTSANKVFTINGGYLKNSAYNRYVGVYKTNPDWRCYDNTTGNIVGQSFAYYKYIAPLIKDYMTTCAVTFTATYEAGAGSGDDYVDANLIEKNAEYIVLGNDVTGFTKTNYRFTGWKCGDDNYAAGATYENVTTDLTFVAQWAEKEDAGLEYTQASYDVIKNGTFIKPTLTNPNNLNVTYSSSNESVASVDAEGNVTLVADATGEAIITASSAATESYKAGEASYTLLVAEKWAMTYTSNLNVDENDYTIIINGTTYANQSHRYGTGNVAGVATINVPKNTQKLHFHAAGWKNETVALKIEMGSTLLMTINALVSEEHISGSDKTYTLTGKTSTDEYYCLDLSSYPITANTAIKFTATAGKRFLLYGVNEEGGIFEITSNTDISDMPENVNIEVKNGKTLTVDENRTLDNLTVEAGGKVETTNELTVINNLTIESEAGKSGQVSNADNVHANNVYMDVTFYKTAETLDATSANQWYMISAPFDVNLNGGFFQTDGTPMVFTVAAVSNSFDLFEYDGSKRASTGKTGWKRASGKMKAGVAYLIGFEAGQKTTIRLKAANTTMTDKDAITLNTYTSTIGTSDENAKNSNWNGVANPNLHYISINKDAQTYNNDARSYNPSTSESTSYVVGTAFFIHGDGNASIVNTIQGDLRAPRRATKAQPIEFCVRLQQENASWANRMYIRASEDASAHYEAGRDLETMNGTNGNNALLWSNNYGMRLAIEEAPIVNDKASYALSLYAPANGTYRIETPTESDNADLYLTKDGRVIWNLSMGTYEAELTKGTTEGYGLLLVRKAPSVATGVDEPTSDSSLKGRATKVVIDEHVYILRGGQMYDVTGKAVK